MSTLALSSQLPLCWSSLIQTVSVCCTVSFSMSTLVLSQLPQYLLPQYCASFIPTVLASSTVLLKLPQRLGFFIPSPRSTLAALSKLPQYWSILIPTMSVSCAVLLKNFCSSSSCLLVSSHQHEYVSFIPTASVPSATVLR